MFRPGCFRRLVSNGVSASVTSSAASRPRPSTEILSRALIRLAPDDLEFAEIAIDNLPLYSQDYDANFPPEAKAMKEAISASDAILLAGPQYTSCRSRGRSRTPLTGHPGPGVNNSFDNMPAAVIGASVGQIGTAMAQQSLRGVLSFCNARQMTTPEAYIQYSPEVFTIDGEVMNESTRDFLKRRHGRVPHVHHPSSMVPTSPGIWTTPVQPSMRTP